MIIYSVTLSLDKDIAAEWLSWMKDVHIPEVMATGFFSDYTLHRLLEPVVDPDAISFNVLYQIDSIERLNDYRRNYSPKLQEKHQAKFGNRYLAVRSVLERL